MSGLGSFDIAKKSIRNIVRANYQFVPESMQAPAQFIDAKVEYSPRLAKEKNKSERTLVLNRAPMGDAELDCVGVLARKCQRVIFLDTQQEFGIKRTRY